MGSELKSTTLLNPVSVFEVVDVCCSMWLQLVVITDEPDGKLKTRPMTDADRALVQQNQAQAQMQWDK